MKLFTVMFTSEICNLGNKLLQKCHHIDGNPLILVLAL